jgi:UDP-2,4-diacetamido-2,4,6-trideoxy-beta-L-altropyranose hydrolase
MIVLRPANMNDADNLLAWRNDPVTLANFRSTGVVPREDHDRWMQFNVQQGYPQHLVLIAESDAGPVGVIRFDADRDDIMQYEVSITVSPKHRGNGLGKDILNQACGYMREYTLNAEIRRDNLPSRLIFRQCGFAQVSSSDIFLQFQKEPQA